jgi:hypothetical protein
MSKKIGIPCEFKYELALKGWTSGYKGLLYAIREEYGAAAALKMYERVQHMDDRIKNLTNFIRTVFKIDGNDVETIAKWWDIWGEIVGLESTMLERSKTCLRRKITECPWKVEYEDIGDYSLIFSNIVVKTINPKATHERVKGMCNGDPYCEYVTKIEE